MLRSKVIVTFIVLLCALFLIFHSNGNYYLADISRVLIVPLFTLLYFVKTKNRSTYLTLFFVAYSISDLLELFNNVFPTGLDYYIGNFLYIIAYTALTLRILESFDFKHVFKYFKTHIVTLIILNIYANHVLFNIQNEYITSVDLSIEVIYNVFTLVLLSVSLMNYFYRDDKKAIILFLGTLCIVVSEVIQIAYYYIPEVEDDTILSVSYSLLIILAFFFYYSQSKLDYEEMLVYA